MAGDNISIFRFAGQRISTDNPAFFNHPIPVAEEFIEQVILPTEDNPITNNAELEIDSVSHNNLASRSNTSLMDLEYGSFSGSSSGSNISSSDLGVEIPGSFSVENLEDMAIAQDLNPNSGEELQPTSNEIYSILLEESVTSSNENLSTTTPVETINNTSSTSPVESDLNITI
jgi:hypothetical protein